MANSSLNSNPFVKHVNYDTDTVVVDRHYFEALTGNVSTVEEAFRNAFNRATREDREIPDTFMKKIDLVTDPVTMKIIRNEWTFRLHIQKQTQWQDEFEGRDWGKYGGPLPPIEKKRKDVKIDVQITQRPKIKKPLVMTNEVFGVTIEPDRSINTLR